ncbi:MAG: hypothetical protein LBE85_06945 [Candidatus Accumulibacter sp.]|jgi:hypothetical protein|nr:hypothetical protein [Accumulibacter sp.]
MASAFDIKKNEILDINRKLAFACIDAAEPGNIKRARERFIKDVEKRRNNPTYIAQGGSSLCGAAAFMYCIAREKPDDFALYALDLALTGKGHLGGLEVTPGQTCRDSESLSIDASFFFTQKRTIAPADWVTLASLRDSTGSLSAMPSVNSDLGGMTFPDALAGWFRGTGWFSAVRNNADILGFNDSLRHLLGINSLPLSYVCLLINASVMTGDLALRIPNHWVVLGDGAGQGGGSNGNDGSTIRIATPGAKILDSRGRPVMIVPKVETPYQHEIAPRVSCLPDSPACVANSGDPRASRRAELEKGKLNFEVYSWAEIRRHPADLTVEKFLTGYFGYVAATV